VARISGFTFSFIAAALLLGSIYGLAHSAPHFATGWSLGLAAFFGTLGLIQIANRVADRFPRRMASVIHWTHAMTFEALAVLAAGLLRPTHHLPSHRAAVGSPTGRPILLIHGYLHDSSAWTYLKRKLQQAGFGPIYCLNLGYPFRSIRDYGEKVVQKAEHIEKETQRHDLILIGHSMGGLVSSWYATRLAKRGTVTDVITIGSPLAGTHVAKFGLGRDAREMELGSALVRELQEEIRKSDPTRFYHIGTKTDQLVIPNTSAIVEGHPERQFIVEDIGHLTLLFSPRIANTIKTWLQN
jgi:predicted esterase YcpF (UPF0227 family)